MSGARTKAACDRAAQDAHRPFLPIPRTRTLAQEVLLQDAKAMQAEHIPEATPTFTLDRFVAEARAEMGEARWAELNREWDA